MYVVLETAFFSLPIVPSIGMVITVVILTTYYSHNNYLFMHTSKYYILKSQTSYIVNEKVIYKLNVEFSLFFFIYASLFVKQMTYLKKADSCLIF